MKLSLNHDELVVLMKLCRMEIEDPCHNKPPKGIAGEQRHLLARVEVMLQKEFNAEFNRRKDDR